VPLRVTQSEPGVHFVTGTPTDCVHLAVSGLFDFDFDNGGQRCVKRRSETLAMTCCIPAPVAAAIEGRFLGLPTLAVSLCTRSGSGGAFHDRAAGRIRAQHRRGGWPAVRLDPRLILNINVPDLPLGELRGLKATRLGFRQSLRNPRSPVARPKG